jgi:AraC-like DNA-binding protein
MHRRRLQPERRLSGGEAHGLTGRRDLAEAVKQVGTNVTGVRGDVSNLGDLDRLEASGCRWPRDGSRTGPLRVASAALEVGYESEVAFGRAFKRIAGVFSAAWRARR